AALPQQRKELVLLEREMPRDFVLQRAAELHKQHVPVRIARGGDPFLQAGERLREPLEQRNDVHVLFVELARDLSLEIHVASGRYLGRKSRTRTALPCERGISPGLFTVTSVLMPIIDLM